MPVPIVIASAPFVLAFLVASFRQPVRIALPAYAALLPFGQGIPTGLPGAFGSVSSLLGIVLGLGLLVQFVQGRRGADRVPVTVPLWLAFLALTGISIFWSIRPQATATSFTVLASLVLLYAFVALMRIERAEFVRLEDALLLGGVAAACYGLAQLLFLGGLPSTDAGSPRFGNDLLGPNNQAVALLLPLVIALGRIMLRSRGGLLVNGSAVLVLLVGILMTGSRGGLLAVAVTFAVLIAASPRGRAAMSAVGVGAVVLVALVLVTNPAGVGERQVNQQDSTSGREEIWAVGMFACRDYCLTGSGWGTFSIVYAQERAFVPEARVLRHGTNYEAHNIWVLAVVEAGLLGLLLVAAALGATFRSAMALPPALRGPPLAAVAGTVFAAFFLSNLEYKFFWMVLIYAVICHNHARNNAPVASERAVHHRPLTTRPQGTP